MAVPKSKNALPSADWYHVFEFSCSLCEPGNECSEAEGYCSTCKEYLCQECYRTHRRPRQMRHHVLLGSHQMPRNQQSKHHNTDTSTEACPSHPTEAIKYFCWQHSQLGCRLCMIRNHQLCKTVDYIADFADEPFMGKEYKNLRYKLTDVTKSVNKVIHTTNMQKKHCRISYTDALGDIVQLRKDLNEAVDALEKNIVKQADDAKEEDEERMLTLKAKCNEILKEIRGLDSDLPALKESGRFCQMFIAMRKVKSKITELEAKLGEVESDIKVRDYMLKPSFYVQKLLKSPETMARLVVVRGNTPYSTKMEAGPADIYPASTISTKTSREDAKTMFQHTAYHSKDSKPGKEHKKQLVLDKQWKHEEQQTTDHPSNGESSTRPVKTKASSKNKQPFNPSQRVSTVPTLAVRPQSTSDHAETDRKSTVLYLNDIEVSSSTDTEKPQINGSVLLPGNKLVLMDTGNSTIKVVDLRQNSIASQLKIPGELWDITHVSSNKVAVTSSGKIFVIKVGINILFVTVGRKLTLDHEIKVAGQCRGIACLNDQFIVSFSHPVKIDILDMKGELLKTLVGVDKGIKLFRKPWYIAIGKDHESFYISDLECDTVTNLDMNGKVKAIYKDKELRSPSKLVVGNGDHIFVCGCRSNTIHQLKADLTETWTLCQRSNQVDGPTSVSYCEASSILYIGTWQSNVKVYRLK